MSWHTAIMTAREFTKFRRDLKQEYRREIAAGRVAGYTVFARKREAGDHLLFIPPAAAILFERIPTWKERLKKHDGPLDLRGCAALPLG